MSQDPSPTDLELLHNSRDGDQSAIAELYRRHRSRGLAIARRFARNSADVEDLLSQAFTAVIAAFAHGVGPNSNFSSYLLTSIRHAAMDADQQHRAEAPAADLEQYLDSTPDHSRRIEQRRTLRRALAGIPSQWRHVVWCVDVEGRPVSEVARMLHTTPGAVHSLLHRAREGLRERYLGQHAGIGSTGPCRVFRPQLAPLVRRRRLRGRVCVYAHIDICADCSGAMTTLRDINESLA